LSNSMRSRLPPLTKDEFKQLHDKLVLAKQILPLAQMQWPMLSAQQAINNIRKEQSCR
jgi:hypothetical protein